MIVWSNVQQVKLQEANVVQSDSHAIYWLFGNKFFIYVDGELTVIWQTDKVKIDGGIMKLKGGHLVNRADIYAVADQKINFN